MKKKPLLIILLSLGKIALILLICALILFTNGEVKDQVKNTVISEIHNYTYDDDGNKLAVNPIDFDSLQKNNDEIVAWIKVPGTQVDYPVLRSRVSDTYYLHRDENKNFNFAGSIYMEYQNNKDFTDPVTVLYGHNMLNDSMFATLHNFRDTDFFNENSTILIYKPGHILTYQIVSAYRSDNKHILNSYDFSDETTLNNYISEIQNPATTIRNVRSGLDITTANKIITLSTCMSNSNYRYLVQGVLVDDEPTQ